MLEMGKTRPTGSVEGWTEVSAMVFLWLGQLTQSVCLSKTYKEVNKNWRKLKSQLIKETAEMVLLFLILTDVPVSYTFAYSQYIH